MAFRRVISLARSRMTLRSFGGALMISKLAEGIIAHANQDDEIEKMSSQFREKHKKFALSYAFSGSGIMFFFKTQNSISHSLPVRDMLLSECIFVCCGFQKSTNRVKLRAQRLSLSVRPSSTLETIFRNHTLSMPRSNPPRPSFERSSF